MDSTPDKAYDAARYSRSGRGKIYDSVLDLVGDTPLVRLPRLTAALKPKAEVVAKLEFFNPLASVKDRIGVSMIEWLEATGKLKPGGRIVEPTSGNTGIALAFVAAAKGYPITLVMPESMSIERRKMLLILGATLELTPAEKGMAGAVARAKLYLEAGADAIFPEALTTAEMFREFARRMPGVPLLANMTEFGRTPFFTASEFEAMGYRMVIWPVSSLRVANKAQEKLYAALARDGGTHAMVDQMQTRVELYKTIGLADYEALDASIVATIAPEGMPQRERSA